MKNPLANAVAAAVIPLVAGCADVPSVSESCEHMCERATSLYGACLEEWGVGWSSAGYDDADAHQESCEVWSWQTSELHGAETIDGICESRSDVFENGTCDDYSDTDWNEVP